MCCEKSEKRTENANEIPDTETGLCSTFKYLNYTECLKNLSMCWDSCVNIFVLHSVLHAVSAWWS